MFKNLAVCLFLFLLSQNGIAQVHITLRALEEAKLQVDSLKVNLSLTPEQTSIITNIKDRYAVRFDSLRMSHSNRFEKFTKTVRLKAERDNELKLLLSDKQFRIYHLSRDARRETDVDDMELNSRQN